MRPGLSSGMDGNFHSYKYILNFFFFYNKTLHLKIKSPFDDFYLLTDFILALLLSSFADLLISFCIVDLSVFSKILKK